jgi:hypothetical protein
MPLAHAVRKTRKPQIRRKERYGAEIVTTEMIVFELLQMPIPSEAAFHSLHYETTSPTDKVCMKTLSVSELTPFLLFSYQSAN